MTADRGSPRLKGWPVWSQALKAVWHENGKDNLSLIAAGVAFYGFLSLVPALSAALLLFGLFASPAMLQDIFASLRVHLPQEAAAVVGDQIAALIAAPDSAKGWGAALALVLAIYGATKGVGGIVTALTMASNTAETRSWLRRTGTVFALTLGAVIYVLLSLAGISALGLPGTLLPQAFDMTWLLSIAGAALLLATAVMMAATLYRFGPPRPLTRHRWFTRGAALAAMGWTAVTSGFAWYSANFGNYGATWGALSGVVVLLTWLYLSAYVLLLGAELDAHFAEQDEPRPDKAGAQECAGSAA